MAKLKVKENGKDYLIGIYNTLYKELRFDQEYFAVADVVDKMYSYDVNLATDWTIDLFNRYGSKGLRDFQAEFDFEGSVRSFIDDLIRSLNEHYTIAGTIKLIHDRIQLVDVRYFLWTYLFSPNPERNKFIVYFKELVNDKKYDEASDMVHLVIDNQGYIPMEIFDVVTFLKNIIQEYTSGSEKIRDQTLLDLLYSFVDLVPYDYGKAVLKSNFVDYLS